MAPCSRRGMPRLAGLLVLASGFEIGIHNSTLAIAVALTVLESTAMAIPSAIHGIVMFPIAAACDAREGVMAEVTADSKIGKPSHDHEPQ